MDFEHIALKRMAVEPKSAGDVRGLLDEMGVEWSEPLKQNWGEEYPYLPDARFRLAYSDSSIVVDYRVNEEAVRAVADADNGRVWEDSCCELFLSPADDGVYYNIECNCACRLLIGCGVNRNDRVRASQDVLDKVGRWSSLGDKTIGTHVVKGGVKWSLSLIIPFDVFFNHAITSIEGKTLRGNIYKCGDKLPKPHFLSWNPVTTLKPDFHRPECFGFFEC